MARCSTAHFALVCLVFLAKAVLRHPLSTHTPLHRSSNETVPMCSLDLTGLNTFVKRNNLTTVLRFLMFSQHRFGHNKTLKTYIELPIFKSPMRRWFLECFHTIFVISWPESVPHLALHFSSVLTVISTIFDFNMKYFFKHLIFSSLLYFDN